jgi:hypothetical protein
MKTLIFDKSAGLLQWISSATDEMEALTEFDAAIGIDPNGKGLSLDEWCFVLVSDEKAAKVQAWADAGSHTADDPLAA